jgi:hypothetical protein
MPRMATASASPVYRSAAHRKGLLQHVGATLVPTALAFAVLAPLVGLGLVWGSTFVALLCNAVATGGAALPDVITTTWSGVTAAYISAGISAAISGVWVAVLSPFAPDNPRFWSGTAIIGMMNAFLFARVGDAGIFGGQLFLALVGAVSVFLAAWLLQNAVLKRDEMRRDLLARERADRLARERNAAKA